MRKVKFKWCDRLEDTYSIVNSISTFRSAPGLQDFCSYTMLYYFLIMHYCTASDSTKPPMFISDLAGYGCRQASGFCRTENEGRAIIVVRRVTHSIAVWPLAVYLIPKKNGLTVIFSRLLC